MNAMAFACAAVSYFTWGAATLYCNQMAAVPAEHLLPYRVMSSFAIMLVVAALTANVWRRVASYGARKIGIYAAGAVLVAINWVAFMYASQIGRGIEASIGYFFVPFVAFLISYVVLQERLSATRYVAIALALLATAILLFSEEIIIWIPVLIAVPFGLYGYIKKVGGIPMTDGILIETVVLFSLAVFMVLADASVLSNIPQYGSTTVLMIIGAGAISLFPLYTFAYAAVNLKLSTLGWMQYIAPTTQLLIGVFVFGNNPDGYTLAALSLIWAAIIMILIEAQIVARRPEMTS